MFEEEMKMGIMKFCPWCNIPVMNDEKCKYVTCDAGCGGKKNFCWDCLKKLNSKHEAHQCKTRDIRLNRLKEVLKRLFRLN